MQNVKLASNHKDAGMAGYLSDRDLMRYRMLRDQGADIYVRPKHPYRYSYKTIRDKVFNLVTIILIVMFAMIPAYIFYMMLDPANWWMW